MPRMLGGPKPKVAVKDKVAAKDKDGAKKKDAPKDKDHGKKDPHGAPKGGMHALQGKQAPAVAKRLRAMAEQIAAEKKFANEIAMLEFPALPPVPEPRMGLPAMPIIEAPPASAIKRAIAIRAESGLQPDQHHDYVRFAINDLERTALAAQQDVIRFVPKTADETQQSILDLGSRILGATSSAELWLAGRINTAAKAIETSYRNAKGTVKEFKVEKSEELDKKRDEVTAKIFERLVKSSQVIADYDTQLQAKFDESSKGAAAVIESIPKGGTVGSVGPGGVMNPSTGSGKSLADVEKTIDGKLAKYWGQIERYENQEMRWQLPAMIAERQKMLEAAATKRAKLLTEPETKTRFREYSFGLFAQPVKKTKEDDPAKDTQTNKKEAGKNQKVFDDAKAQVLDDLETRGSDAVKRVREQEGPEMRKNLRQVGAKMYAAIQGQAKQIRYQLASLAAPMAEAYVDIVKRLPPHVPPKQFLDFRSVGPQIRALIEAATQIKKQHTEAIAEQATTATKSVEDSLPEQLRSIRKQAEDQANGLFTFYVTPAKFDFGMAAVKFTGNMNAGVEGAMDDATKYIETVVKQKQKEATADKPYASQLEQMALGFLNNSIQSALTAHDKTVDSTAEEYGEAGKGPFQGIKKAADGEVTTRAHSVDHAVPHRSTAGKIVTGVLSVGLAPVGGAAIGAGYAYATRSSASDVEIALGELKFPAAKAIEEYFNSKIDGEHTMVGRIKERLNDTDAAACINLLSEDAGDRAKGRQAIAHDSYSIFGSSRAAREAVLKGMDHAEKIASPATIKAMSDEMVSELKGSKLNIAQAYLDDGPNGPGKVLSARIEESLGEARRKGDDALIQTLDQISTMARKEQNTAYVSPAQLDKITRDAIIQHAIETKQFKGTFEELEKEEAKKPGTAAELFTASVTRARIVAPTMIGNITVGTVDLTKIDKATAQNELRKAGANVNIEEVKGPVKDYVKKFAELSMATTPEEKQRLGNELWAIRGGYEMGRAQDESGSLSKKQTVRLSGALQDDAYFEMRRKYDEAPADQKIDLLPALKKAEKEHEEKLELLAKEIVKNEKNPTAAAADLKTLGAHEFVKQRATREFARESGTAQLSRVYDRAKGYSAGPKPEDYGREIIDLGRPKLLTQVMLASRGSGTNDDLLKAAYTNRSKKEIAEANRDYATMTHGEDLEVMLGIRKAGTPRSEKEQKELGIKPPRERSTLETIVLYSSPLLASIEAPETSGDLAMELQRLAKGKPESDLDFAELAALQHQQERVEGTGFIAKGTMAGTSEQVELDRSKAELADMIKAATPADFQKGEVFGPNGEITENYRHAFDDKGKLRVPEGDTTTRFAFYDKVYTVQRNAEAYRTEIDRQEAMFTSIISAIAIAVSVVLLFIPGVNVVAAGVIVALLAGAATIAVKAGMRGARYGYEEMLTDVAMTAIEAGTAALGGKLASGLGKAAAARGALAKVGVALESRLGKVGGTMAREAIVGFTGGAAKAAIQSSTWDDGIGAGLGKVFGAGARGAAVAGISAGISTSISAKLGSKLEPALVDGSKASNWQKLASKLGPTGTEMVREVIANTAGALTGDLVNIFIDVASGNFHGELRDVLAELGQTAAREIFTNVARSAVTVHMRQRYEKMLSAARSGGSVSEADLKVLQRAAVSAGQHLDVEGVRHEVNAGRVALEGVPAGLRPMLAGYNAEDIAKIKSSLANPELGTPRERLDLIRELKAQPGWDGKTIAGRLDEVRVQRVEAARTADLEVQARRAARAVVASQLEAPVRRAMADIDVSGLARLPAMERRRAAAMIASGNFDQETAVALAKMARRADPKLDERAFINNLRAAAERVGDVRAENRIAAARELETQRPTGGHGPDEAPVQKLVVEAFVGPKVESVLDIIAKRPGAKVVGLEEGAPPSEADQQRVRDAGGEFVTKNKPTQILSNSVDEILMRFPLPHERELAQAGTRLFHEIAAQYPKNPTPEQKAEIFTRFKAANEERAKTAETLVNYAPYALEKLKPGGQMEVVFWEGQIIHQDIPRVTAMTHLDPETGVMYRLVADAVVQRPRDIAPFSGHFGLPENMTTVNVVVFRKVPLASNRPTGATGPTMEGGITGEFSGRSFRPGEAGGPVRELDWRRVKITDAAIDVVEQHIRRFDGGGELEVAMVGRLRRIARGETPVTDHDLRFYTHELRELVRYRRLGFAEGQPIGDEASYRLWNSAHSATLEDYKLREGKGVLFHPEVEALEFKGRPSGARGPEEVPALEPRTRKVVEAELADVGHDKSALKTLGDAELMAIHRQAQIDQLPARLDTFRRGLSEEARGQFDELRASGHKMQEPVDHPLAKRLSTALETPVTFDEKMPAGTVKVVYERGLLGNIKGIRIVAGPGATLADIFFHAPTVTALRRYEGVAGVVRRAIGAAGGLVGLGYLPPGSRAHEAYLELQKLPAIIDAHQQRLGSAPLDERTRARVEGLADALEAQLSRHMEALADRSKGRGFIAAEGKEELQPLKPATKEEAEAAVTPGARKVYRSKTQANELALNSVASEETQIKMAWEHVHARDAAVGGTPEIADPKESRKQFNAKLKAGQPIELPTITEQIQFTFLLAVARELNVPMERVYLLIGKGKEGSFLTSLDQFHGNAILVYGALGSSVRVIERLTAAAKLVGGPTELVRAIRNYERTGELPEAIQTNEKLRRLISHEILRQNSVEPMRIPTHLVDRAEALNRAEASGKVSDLATTADIAGVKGNKDAGIKPLAGAVGGYRAVETLINPKPGKVLDPAELPAAIKILESFTRQAEELRSRDASLLEDHDKLVAYYLAIANARFPPRPPQ